MTQKFTFDPDDVDYGGPRRSTTIPTTRATREPPRQYPHRHHPNHSNSSHEAAGEKEKQRRRIAVACSRCRKRKIKCSGDLGNGQGCQNCKNAGTDPNQCQFLRVSSTKWECVSGGPEWPYLPHGMPSAPITGHSLHPLYHQNSNSSMPSLGSSSYPGAHRLASRYNSSQYSYPISGGQDYYNNYATVNSADGMFDNYAFPAQQDSYLSSQDPQPPSTLYGPNDGGRAWGPTPVSRAGSGGYIPEISPRYTPSSLGYSVPHTSTTSRAPDGAPTFPGLGALGSALSASLTSERVLPNPKSGIIPSSTDALAGTGQSYYSEPVTSMPSTQPCPPKLQGPWGLERAAATGLPAPFASLSNNGGILSSNASPRMTLPPNSTSPDSAATPTSTYTLESTNSSVGGMESNILSDQVFMPSLSSEGRDPLRSQAIPNSYNYSLSSKRSTGSPTSDGTLMNGQPYTCLRQPPAQPHSLQHFEDRRQNTLPLRTSITSLSNPLR